MSHMAGFVSDEQSNSPCSIRFLQLPAEIRNEVYIILGLGTPIRPPNASSRKLGCCYAKHCGSSDRYEGESFVPKDLLAFSSTCKELCLEIRPLIFARSTLLLTTSQLRIFHSYRFRHQLFDFWPWLHVRKLVLHILPEDVCPNNPNLPEDQEREAGEQIRILGRLDLSKIELVILYPHCYLGESWYFIPILELLKPLSGADNVQFETCSKYNDHGEPFTVFDDHDEYSTHEARDLEEMRQMFAEMAVEARRGKSVFLPQSYTPG